MLRECVLSTPPVTSRCGARPCRDGVRHARESFEPLKGAIADLRQTPCSSAIADVSWGRDPLCNKIECVLYCLADRYKSEIERLKQLLAEKARRRATFLF